VLQTDLPDHAISQSCVASLTVYKFLPYTLALNNDSFSREY